MQLKYLLTSLYGSEENVDAMQEVIDDKDAEPKTSDFKPIQEKMEEFINEFYEDDKLKEDEMPYPKAWLPVAPGTLNEAF